MQNFSYFQDVYIDLRNSKKKHLIFRSMVNDDIQEISELTVNVHFTTHPYSILYAEDYRETYKNHIVSRLKNIIPDDLSIVAVDTDNNKLISCLTGIDLFHYQEYFRSDDLPKEKQEIHIALDFSDKFPQYFNIKKPNIGLYLFNGIIHPSYYRYGLGSLVASSTIQNHPNFAKYSYILAKLSSYYSLKMFKRIGFRELETREYESLITASGLQPFKGIKDALLKKGLSPDHTHVTLAIYDKKPLPSL